MYANLNGKILMIFLFIQDLFNLNKFLVKSLKGLNSKFVLNLAMLIIFFT
uniref:Uncharacterized protein n=1 Tax=Physcomitrium patens TaxID=3218 RepID=A0A2K1L2P7_PHYPA|nr:hypothetical protein PHYPA_003089 [Physcomitrium patens]